MRHRTFYSLVIAWFRPARERFTNSGHRAGTVLCCLIQRA